MGTPEQHRSRLAELDTTRGIAILLVVFGHAIHMVARTFSVEMPAWISGLDRAIYTFHVPVFFLVSGILFSGSWTRRGGRDLLWHRAKTLLYPYALWSILHVILEHARQGLHAKSLYADLLKITYFPPAHFWFLYVLFLCVLIATAARSILANEKPWARALLFLALCWYGAHVLLPPGPLRDTGRALPFFAAGALWSAMGGRSFSIRAPWVYASAAWGVFVGAVSIAILHGLETDPLFRLPLGLAGVAATCLTAGALRDGALARWLANTGERSLPIYLLHVFVLSGCCHALYRIGINWRLALPLVVSASVWIPLAVATWARHARLARRLNAARWMGLG